MSSAGENKALVRRFVADELLAPDFAWKPPGKDASIEDYKRWVAKQLAASSDLHFSIEERIAEGVQQYQRRVLPRRQVACKGPIDADSPLLNGHVHSPQRSKTRTIPRLPSADKAYSS
jgi:hypothetical protein